MPLVQRDYYTPQEAIDLIKEYLPDEDAGENLLDALDAGELTAKFIAATTGRETPIPNELWRSRDSRLQFSFSDGQCKMWERLVARPAPYSNKSYVTWNRDGKATNRTVNGMLRIDRSGLDEIVSTLPKPTKTMAAEARCNKFLKEEVERLKGQPPSKTKGRYYADAREIAGEGLARRSFDRSWDLVTPASWKKSGPKKKPTT